MSRYIVTGSQANFRPDYLRVMDGVPYLRSYWLYDGNSKSKAESVFNQLYNDYIMRGYDVIREEVKDWLWWVQVEKDGVILEISLQRD